jgi:chromosome segregation ATPase
MDESITGLKRQLKEVRLRLQQCTAELQQTQQMTVDLNDLTDVQDQEISSLERETARLTRENDTVQQRYADLDQSRRREQKQADKSLQTIRQLSIINESLRQTIRSTESVESKLRGNARKAELQRLADQDTIEDYMESSTLCETDRQEERATFTESLAKCTDRVVACETGHRPDGPDTPDTSSHCSQCRRSMS